MANIDTKNNKLKQMTQKGVCFSNLGAFPPYYFSNLGAFPPYYFSNLGAFPCCFCVLIAWLSIFYMLKKVNLQEFYKDISNKKGDFRHLGGKAHKLLKSHADKTTGKREQGENSQAQRGKVAFPRALKNVYL